MIDFKDRISSSAEFDQAKYWRFERNSGLPYGTFGKGVNPDVVVVIGCALCLIVGLAVATWS